MTQSSVSLDRPDIKTAGRPDPAGARRLYAMLGGSLVLLAVTWMLIPGMADYSMWHDEVQVVTAAANLTTLQDLFLLDGFQARIVHPPLFFVLLKFWMAALGQTDFALRALPALGSLVTAAFVYRTTVDLSGRPAGGMAAALIWGSMGLVAYYVHEVHNYSLLMTGAAMMVFFYYRWWLRRRPRYTVGLILATLMLLYTHYASIYLILAFTLHVLLTGGEQIWRWIRLQTMVGLGYLPWLPTFYRIITGVYMRTEAAAVAATSSATTLPNIAATLQRLLYDGWPYYGVLLAVGGAAAAIRPAHSRTRLALSAGWLLLVGGGSLVLTLIGNTFWQTLAARRILYLLVIVAMLLGYGLVHVPSKLRWALLAVFLVLTPNQLPAGLPGNWFYRQSIEYVASRAQSGEALYIDFSGALEAVPLRYYAEHLLPDGIPFHSSTDAREEKLNTYSPRERIWVIWDPAHASPSLWQDPAFARKPMAETERIHLAQLVVSLYSAPAGRPIPSLTYINPAALPLPQVFGDQLELVRSEVDTLDVRPGGRIKVSLDWRALRPIPQDLTIFLHVIEGDFVTLHGQGDGPPLNLGVVLSPLYWPAEATIYDEREVTVSPDTPPGRYYLRTGLGSNTLGYRLSVQPGDGISPDDGVVIARIEVR